MAFIAGLTIFNGVNFHESPTPNVQNINRLEVSNSIVDEVAVHEDANINMSKIKDEWQRSSRLIAKFMNNLEAGNVGAQGLQIVSFSLKRRRPDELVGTTLAYLPFVNDSQLTYTDYSQGTGDYIYSVVPIAENKLEGIGSSVKIYSDFTGYFLVDVETDQVFEFDKAIGDVGNVDFTYNKNRTQVDTFSRFPRFISGNQKYHSFSLSTVLIPQGNEKSNQINLRLMSLIDEDKPLLVKGGNGSLYVCYVSDSPQQNSPQNTFSGYDYITVTLKFTEVMTYEDYMNEQIIYIE